MTSMVFVYECVLRFVAFGVTLWCGDHAGKKEIKFPFSDPQNLKKKEEL